MPMMPKRVKFRKSQRGKNRGVACRGNTVAFGEFGLQALAHAWITAKQIEAGRVAASHFMRREGRVFIRVFPHKPISAKPLEKPGTMLFEIQGVDEATAKKALARVAFKMPIRTRFVHRKHAVA